MLLPSGVTKMLSSQWLPLIRLCLFLSVISVCQSMKPKHAKNAKVYNVTHLLDKLLEGYDNRLRPGFGSDPTVIDVNMNIRSMGPVSEIDMAYQMDCYFRQSWVDRRLRFKGNDTPSVLPVAITILDLLWKPDTHFFNGMKSYLHVVTSPNKLLRIHDDGKILYSMRLTIKATCPMHLESFPMDIQTCPLTFGSHGYSTTDLVYVWTYGTESIKMAPDMTLSQFDLIGSPHGNESRYQHNIGTFSMLFAKFTLRRHMGYFLINVYVPCSLLVILSWVAFWINREATSDRVALGVTVVLTMCFMNIDNRRDIPKVSYSTALDYFVGGCFTFVLATIIQFAGVHFFTKHDSGEINHDSDSEEEVGDENNVRSHLYSSNDAYNRPQMISTGNVKINGETVMTPRFQLFDPPAAFFSRIREHCCVKFWNCLLGSHSYRMKQQRQARFKNFNSVSKIDKISRIVFPVLFFVFNIFYWAVYLRGNIDTMAI